MYCDTAVEGHSDTVERRWVGAAIGYILLTCFFRGFTIHSNDKNTILKPLSVQSMW